MTLEHKTIIEIADAVADTVNGTTMMTEEAIEQVCNIKDIEIKSYDVLMMDSTFCARLDERVMCCATCGWWVESHEIGEDGESCTECTGENEEEE